MHGWRKQFVYEPEWRVAWVKIPLDERVKHNYILAKEIWQAKHFDCGLPFEGGWMQQPFWMIKIIENFENEWIAKQNEDMRRESKSNASGTNG